MNICLEFFVTFTAVTQDQDIVGIWHIHDTISTHTFTLESLRKMNRFLGIDRIADRQSLVICKLFTQSDLLVIKDEVLGSQMCPLFEQFKILGTYEIYALHLTVKEHDRIKVVVHRVYIQDCI